MSERATVLSALIGRPWRARARGPEAYDCWGLVRAAALALSGWHLPDDDADPADLRRVSRLLTDPARRAGMISQAGRPVAEAPDGAVVLLTRGAAVPHHVGLWLRPERGILHCCPTQRVVLDTLGHVAAAGWRIVDVVVPCNRPKAP